MWWVTWQGLNWRGKWARIYSYFKVGNNLIQDGKNVLLIAASFKILGLPVEWAIALGVGLLGALPVLGWTWMRTGLFRQEQEISMVDAWNKPGNFEKNLIVATAKRVGVVMARVSADELCPEIRAILASGK